jgi:glycosyltransferase involved in cell wall biosynthesis
MDTGGKIRTGKILEQLVEDNEITFISNVESPKDDPYLPQLERLCTGFIPVHWKETKKYSLLFYVRLFIQMYSRYPASVLNDYSKNLSTAVERECSMRNYDVAICDFVQSALMFRNINGIPIILFQHNVESMIAKRHFKQSGNIVTKIFWWLQWKKMFSFESKACKAFDTVIAVSDKDQETFQSLYNLDNIVTIPTGVDINYFKPLPGTTVEENSLVFCGSMDWLANENAIVFFIENILLRIREKIQAITLTVVGGNPSPSLQKLVRGSAGIKLTGWVVDTRPYIARSVLFIVPIRIGGGTRMKIYEAMAMGKTVISTSVGAEGLPVTNGKNIIIEDDPACFAEKIVDLLKNRQKRKEIGSAAYTFVHKYFTWKGVAEEFSKICRETLINNNLT